MPRFALAAVLDLPTPSLEDVRKDAAEAPNVRSQVSEDDLTPLLMAPPGQRLPKDRLPSLFAFSARAASDAVPRDLVGECIWALETLLFRCVLDPNRSNDIMVHLTLRLATLYMRPDVEWPDRAAQIMNNLFGCFRRTDPSWNTSVLPSKIRLMYAVALAKTAVDDDEAERILTSILNTNDSGALVVTARIKVQLYLSRVLRRKGCVQNASAIESELVRWFKRNPHVFYDEELESLFLAHYDNGETDPVLAALGGPNWFQNRKRTAKTEQRRIQSCAQCEAHSLNVTLKKCGACKDTWYCSSKCQKANWPFHRELCKWLKECNKYLETTEQEGDANQRLCRELNAWSNWDAKTHPHVVAHALGIHRDATRGRTHIFYKQVEHNRTADSVPKMFITIACGVFRLEDVLGWFEKRLKLGKGKGREYFRKYFLPFENGKASHTVPMLEIVNCRQGPYAVVCKGMSLAEIKQFPYEPNWMRSVNPIGQNVPKTLLQWDGAKNAEHD